MFIIWICKSTAILGPFFSIIIALALIVTVVKLLTVLKKIIRAVADPVRLEMDILGEQLGEIQDNEFGTSLVEPVSDNKGL